MRPYLMYGLIFAAFLLLHLVMLRDVVMAIPAILQGNATIVREELVPFYDFARQFWSSGASQLTSSDEVRVAYSFWTAWVRHDKVLPFALILMNTLSLFLLFFSFHRIGKYFAKHRPLFGVIAAILAAVVIYSILLYAKVAHFYVLIIGFSLFALAVSLMLEQIFFRRELSWTGVTAVSLLVLLNPAIHFHIIFYVLFAVVVAVHLVFNFALNRKYFGYYLRKNLLYFVVVTLASLLPYVALIYFTTSSSLDTVSTDIPVNYWMIYYTSLPLQFIFSFDTAGHLDLIRYGDYLAPLPRFGSVIITGLVAGLFIFKNFGSLSILKKVVVMTLFITMLAAMWMSIGYSPRSTISFHMVLSSAALLLAEQSNALAGTISDGLSVFINVLRFPHRFQFIYFYAGGLLFMIALVWLRGILQRRTGRALLSGGLVALIALFPITASADYRSALTSGNLATFLTPYEIPDDLKNIRSLLAAQDDDRLFILPTMESGREIVEYDNRFGFLDKFFIYYLDQPTFYYGVGANTQNKILAYLVYEAIADGQPWWEDVLVSNIGVTHILVPKNIEPRNPGITYFPEVDDHIDTRLDESEYFSVVYDGEDFALYQADIQTDSWPHTMVDLQWKNVVDELTSDNFEQQRTHFPLQLGRLASQERVKLVSDNTERSFYTLYAHGSPDKTFYPAGATLPFSPSLVASSNFTNTALSLSILRNKDDAYNFLDEEVANLTSLRVPSFVGLTQGDGKMPVNFTVPENGDYRLVLHGASRSHEITANLGGQLIQLEKIQDDRTDEQYVEFSYFVADVRLMQGRHSLDVINSNENSVLAESLTAVPTRELPGDFGDTDSHLFAIRPTADPGTYELQIKEAMR
jgi:hypothetical protein